MQQGAGYMLKVHAAPGESWFWGGVWDAGEGEEEKACWGITPGNHTASNSPRSRGRW